MDMLRRRPYLKRVLADRYWLEEALEHKDEVISLPQQPSSAKRRLRVFREEFDRFAGIGR